MLANEGSGTSGSRGPPPINSKPTFVFSTWLIMFAAFLRKFPLVFRAYQMEVPKKETPDQKAQRIEDYGEESQKAYSYLVEACGTSSVAMGIVVNHAATADETRLASKYTLKTADDAFHFAGVDTSTNFDRRV